MARQTEARVITINVNRYTLIYTSVFDATPQQVFRVLLDYDRLEETSESIRESRYLESDVKRGPGHYVFLNTCTERGTRYVPICKDAEGVDRSSTHERVSRIVVDHFRSAFVAP